MNAARRAAVGLRILSWNVNGIRAVARKGFGAWFLGARPFVLGVQETKAAPEQFPPGLDPPPGYSVHAAQAVKKGYSGVATFSQLPAVATHSALGFKEFDDEGRVAATEHEAFVVFNVYFPKGSGPARDNSRVPYKLKFYDALITHALKVKKKTGKPLIVMGDFNTAHGALDLANPKSNVKNSGFLPEEREDLTRQLGRGFVDTFRALHPDKVQYSWWRNWPGVRERNVGWRIDGVWVSKEMLPNVKEAFILDDVRGSDHCPVGITLGV